MLDGQPCWQQSHPSPTPMSTVYIYIYTVRYTSCWGGPGKCHLKARWGGTKTLGGILRYTLGIKKIKMPNLIPCPGGREKSFCAKTGGKNVFFDKN